MDRIQFKASVEVAASPEAVWDYTQDYGHRAEWDPSILEARVESEGAPERVVWIRGAGSLQCRLRYKQFERPSRTSLAMFDVHSPLFSGGGSWSYEPAGSGTRWTQQNSLVFRRPWQGQLLGALLRWWLQRTTESAMRRVKAHLEAPAR